ncbi:HD domain-containing protein [Streptomyces sp. 549]|uniref:HD-GYP domain-containing protein n=1 Tax=Streptomyces sp. 549 TaxID=3049076 RepID=UPI0024C42EB5|nr:HD domain-containing protein [Streptomyces sp. 549]MDK1476687.1 HD domain-containing protein [Streptomyces sp. 549]
MSPVGFTVRAAAVLVAAASLGWTLRHGLDDPAVAVAFGLVVLTGELLRAALPGDGEAAPLAAAAALGYALLVESGGEPAAPGAAQAVTVTAAAVLLGLARRQPPGGVPAADGLARRVLTVAFAAACFQPLHASGALGPAASHGQWHVVVMLAVLVLTGLSDAVLGAALSAGRAGRPFAALLRDELRALRGIGSAVCATGAVIAPAVATAGLWALPVFCVPLLLTQLSLRRYGASQTVYRQTIASLARSTEVAGHTPPGHARRVAELSRATGRRLGLPEAELTVLEYAALMHDIGQLSLLDPVPGGATELLAADSRRRIARLGGAVARQSGVREEVAVIVERQADPFRGQPLPARIVRAANAYEDHRRVAAGACGPVDGSLRALEQLRLATAHELDPRVVEALAGVVSRGASD